MTIYTPFKRLMDIIMATLLLILFLPVWFIVPVLIKRDSQGPIFYKHRRVGKGGREFEMYKFRSMVNNAHQYLHEQNPVLLKRFKESDWKLADDPRITKVGKVLRSTSVDEFPQLVNVLKGEMSIVGPRAYMKQELEEQTDRYPETKKNIKAIYLVKPGITGPWQISGRNDVPFVKRTQLDAEYASHLSLKNDLLIILNTPLAMFSKW